MAQFMVHFCHDCLIIIIMRALLAIVNITKNKVKSQNLNKATEKRQIIGIK